MLSHMRVNKLKDDGWLVQALAAIHIPHSRETSWPQHVMRKILPQGFGVESESNKAGK